MNKKNLKIHKKNNYLLGHLYINCAIKNTIFSLTDSNGQVLKQWSSKSLRTKELKKNTPYNIQYLINLITKYLIINKIRFIKIFFKGKGVGRYNVIPNINLKKIKIIQIFDNTYLPFNGCRNSKKKRR